MISKKNSENEVHIFSNFGFSINRIIKYIFAHFRPFNKIIFKHCNFLFVKFVLKIDLFSNQTKNFAAVLFAFKKMNYIEK